MCIHIIWSKWIELLCVCVCLIRIYTTTGGCSLIRSRFLPGENYRGAGAWVDRPIYFRAAIKRHGKSYISVQYIIFPSVHTPRCAQFVLLCGNYYRKTLFVFYSYIEYAYFIIIIPRIPMTRSSKKKHHSFSV